MAFARDAAALNTPFLICHSSASSSEAESPKPRGLAPLKHQKTGGGDEFCAGHGEGLLVIR